MYRLTDVTVSIRLCLSPALMCNTLNRCLEDYTHKRLKLRQSDCMWGNGQNILMRLDAFQVRKSSTHYKPHTNFLYCNFFLYSHHTMLLLHYCRNPVSIGVLFLLHMHNNIKVTAALEENDCICWKILSSKNWLSLWRFKWIFLHASKGRERARGRC